MDFFGSISGSIDRHINGCFFWCTMNIGTVLFRWKSTLSIDGLRIIPRALSVMVRFLDDYGWGSVILVANSDVNLGILKGHLESDKTPDNADFHATWIQKDAGVVVHRFLWYWVRKYYDGGFGGLKLYIDSDRRFVSQLRRDRLPFPITSPLGFDFEKLLTRIRTYTKHTHHLLEWKKI